MHVITMNKKNIFTKPPQEQIVTQGQVEFEFSVFFHQIFLLLDWLPNNG